MDNFYFGQVNHSHLIIDTFGGGIVYNSKQQALDNAYATLIKRAKKILSERKSPTVRERKEIIVPSSVVNNIKVSG